MANRTTYEILAKTKGFKDSEKQVKGLNGALGGLAQKALAVGGAYFGARALLDGVNASIQAFSQQEVAEKKLEQALGRTSQALLDQATALQNVTTFGDDAIIAQQGFLASIGMTEEQIKDILPVAADLAAATGMTLESAVRNTAKTFSGLAGELGELVPQLRDLSPEAMKAGEAVTVMADLFKGQAIVQSQSLEGMTIRVQNAMGDMAQEIGRFLAPAVRGLADEFLRMSGNSTEVEDILHDLVSVQQQIRIAELELEAGMRGSNQARIDSLKSRENELQILARKAGLNAEEIDGFTDTLDMLSMDEEARIRLNALMEQGVIQKLDLANATSIENMLYTEQGTIISDLTEEQLKAFKKRQRLAKISEKVVVMSNSNILGSFATLNEAVAGNAQVTKGLTMAQALADTYAGANSALREGTGITKFIQAAAIIAQGLANVKRIDSAYKKQGAQYGFEGMVDEPTQFTVGEGGAAEYVSVQPMEGVNNAGGGGININISGNVMSEQFVEEELAERISEAVRKGVDFGMS